MAKQRRPQPKTPKTQTSAAQIPPARPAPGAPGPPQRRTTYVEAVALYERGLEALQRHEYRGAADLFESVLRQYPKRRSCTSASVCT